jgi:Ethanolamine utilization protein EutJ (predicted chaperonin)
MGKWDTTEKYTTMRSIFAELISKTIQNQGGIELFLGQNQQNKIKTLPRRQVMRRIYCPRGSIYIRLEACGVALIIILFYVIVK